MPQMGGGSAVLNLGHAQAIRSFFELKRKVLRGKGKDFSDNTWDKLMTIVDDMQQKENLLVTYSHALKNAEFDSAGNVRDVASFNNTLKKKETLVLQLAGSYVKVSSIADVMMNDNLEQ
jgi:mRNA-degrading endonuclease HigB of HigAB toxin-antitoxin module